MANTPVMNSPNKEVVNNSPVITGDAVVKKRVSHTLPAKYSKFIEFGYYLLTKVSFNFIHKNTDDSEVVFDEKELLNKLHLLESIDVQQQFVQEFFDTSKDIHTTLKTLVKTHTKKQRVPKEKKEKVVKVPAEKKEKKQRVKKEKKQSSEDELVNELVLLAGGSGEPTVPPEAPSLTKSEDKKQSAIEAVNTLLKDVPPIQEPVKEKKEKVVKEKVLKEKKEKVVKEKVVKEKPVKEKKEKVVKDKPVKDNKVKVVENTLDASDDHDDELQVSVFNYLDKQYLIDDNFNVYDFNTHSLIATFINQQFVLI